MDADALEQLGRRCGRRLAGAFAFGTSPAMADELLAYVRAGSKRATVEAVATLEADDDPFPTVGACWALLDGRGEARFVMETVQLRVGRLDSVDPRFAWDEGEGDRTLEDWLEGHRRYFAQQGIGDPDAVEVVFERFRIVWPDEDGPVWLVDGVRELEVGDHPWADAFLAERHGDGAVATAGGPVVPAALPALVAERAGDAIGLLTFRARPGGVADVATVDATGPDAEATVARLLAGAQALAGREGWRSLRGPDAPGR